MESTFLTERLEPGLLFLHGWGGSARYWDEALKNLDLTGLRAITTSFRGHGDSDTPATGYCIERFAEDMFGDVAATRQATSRTQPYAWWNPVPRH
ncbi:MAG: alpha/beta hydrolase [Acidobacteria bacterium]|nr:alpha/beta hydrolase [Acidobacteriota bacterium]